MIRPTLSHIHIMKCIFFYFFRRFSRHYKLRILPMSVSSSERTRFVFHTAKNLPIKAILFFIFFNLINHKNKLILIHIIKIIRQFFKKSSGRSTCLRRPTGTNCPTHTKQASPIGSMLQNLFDCKEYGQP